VAPLGNRNAVGNKGGGRPTVYCTETAVLAEKLCLLGATDAQLAEALDVCETTINTWKSAHPEFSEALKKGKARADAEVAASLFHRAKGYSHDAVKIVADAKTGAEHIVPYTEHYPPDTTACIFWLKNRRPDLWRDKHDIDQTSNLTVKVVNYASAAG